MRLLIEIGIGFGAFSILMTVLGMVILPQSEDDTDITNKVQPTSKTYMGSLDSLLPTIDELGLNWRMDEKVDPNMKLLKMVISEDSVEPYDIESIGLLESASQKYTKLGTPSTLKFWTTVSLYKFNTTDEASQQWNNIKDFQNKNRAFDIYGETENCRSIQESRTFNDLHTDLCYKNNILILIEYSTDVAIQYYDVQDDFELLPIIIKNTNNS